MGATQGSGADDFPAELEFAGQRLPLEYRFVPGDPADGVSVRVRLALLNAMPVQAGEWLVPGLLHEKVAELIRGLPKSLRRNFVPAPDFARAFVQAQESLAAIRSKSLTSVLAAYLQKTTGVDIGSTDFDAVELPPHLRLRYRIFDTRQMEVATGRDLVAIQAEWASAAREAFSRRADANLSRDLIDGFDIDDIPETIRSDEGLLAFPALVDLGASVGLRVFEQEDLARAEHRRGVERLLRLGLADAIKRCRRQLPLGSATSLKWAALGSVETLRVDLVDAALAERLQSHDLQVRTRADFNALQEAISRELFGVAVKRLELAESIIATHAELVTWLEPPMMGFAAANYADLNEQRDELLAPGFLRETDPTHL